MLFASRIVSDAVMIRDYYLETYKADSTLIRYGFREVFREEVKAKSEGREEVEVSGDVHSKLGVKPFEYVLFVSRLEPENNAHRAIEAYNMLPPELKEKPLLVVGDAPYAKKYIEGLHQMAGENVIFAGYQFGKAYEELQLGAYIYIQATEVGGTHPALVESLGFANCVIANDTPEHVEVIEDAGVYYSKNNTKELSEKLKELLEDSDKVKSFREKAYNRANKEFSWDSVTEQYIEVLSF